MRLPDRSSRFGLPAFFPPQSQERVFVLAHDYSGVGSSNKGAPKTVKFLITRDFRHANPPVKTQEEI